MDRGDGYDAQASTAVRVQLIPHKPTNQYRPPPQRAPESYEPQRIESRGSEPPQRAEIRSWDSSRSQTSTPTTLGRDKYAYQPYVPASAARTELHYSTPSATDLSNTKGFIILPTWRRHLITWVIAFMASVFFVFTIIFAWNATGGQNADTRLLFENPGRTILVLQILGTVTTALFAELVIASCEMLRWALSTSGTKFTTFLGLSRATALYGQIYLFLSKYTHAFMLFQRLLLYLLVFTCSIILLASVSIPISFPVLVPIANGTSGLGEFGSADPTFTFPEFHFGGFLQDATSVVGLDPVCDGDDCYSYFLPGGLNSVNNSCERATAGVPGKENFCAALKNSSGLSEGDLGTLSGVGGLLGGSENSTEGVDILGALRNGSGSTLADVLGGGSSLIPGAGVLGGLLKKRQLDSDPSSVSNYSSQLLAISGNSVNWTDFRSNLTHDFGNQELAYVTYNASGYHMDFSPAPTTWPSFNNLCTTFLAVASFNVSLTFCIATEAAGESSAIIDAGIRYCDDLGLFGIPCSNESTAMVYSTRMHIRSAYGTTAYSMSNATIISFKELSTPVDYPLNVTAFFEALTSPFLQSRLVAILELGNPNAALDTTPILVLSLLSDFVFGGQGPRDGPNTLRSLMANAISSASPIQFEGPNSSPQAVTKIIFTIRLAPATLYTFIVLGSLVLLWCFPVMIWSTMHLTGNTSGFPEVDFAAKIGSAGALEGISNAESKGIVQKLAGSEIFVGEYGREGMEGGKAATIVLDTAPVEMLRKNVSYY